MTVKRRAWVIGLVLLALTALACRGTPTPTATSTPTPTDTPVPATGTPTPSVATATSTPTAEAPTPTPIRAASLSADRAKVQYRRPGEAMEEVDVGGHEPVGAGDEISTNETGLGILTFTDFLRVEIFRRTGLQLKAAPDPDAPPIVKLYLALGTTLQTLQQQMGKRVVVTTETDWATITSVATTYLISVDEEGVTSVVVYEGVAEVEAQQRTVTLRPGEATFVKPRQAPRPPSAVEMAVVEDWVRAARQPMDVGSIKPVIFPPADVLTPTSTATAIRTPTARPVDVDVTVAHDNPPVVEQVYVEPSTIYQGDEFVIELVASDDVGLQSIRWRIEGTGYSYFDSGDEADCGGTTRCELNWSLKWAGEAGQYTVYAQARDTAGQLSSVGSAAIGVLEPADLGVQTIDRLDVGPG